MTDAAAPLTVIVLAAGEGTRMRSSRPKVLHEIAGRSMLRWVLASAEALAPQRIVVVIGPDHAPVAAAAKPHETVIQADRRGTGHAVQTALDAADVRAGSVLVLFADVPLVPAPIMAALVEAGARGLAVLGFEAAEPGRYGRLVMGAAGLERIVEAADADAETLALGLCNSGLMAGDAAAMRRWLSAVQPTNAQGEYYLTDCVALARAEGRAVPVITAAEADVHGVNTRAQLAAAEALAQARLRQAAMAAGATLIDPASTFFSYDTKLGRDVVVGPSVVFLPQVVVEDEVEIRAFSHLEGCTVARGAIIGPFARLRPGAVIGAGAHVGNFVELKAATLGAGAKANHLAYLGDADIGAGANIGAGTITCNYDGFFKHRTVIGAGAFIGSNSALVAPVTIGDGALVGAGSTIVRDVPADAAAIARGEQIVRQGAAARIRERKRRQKEAR